MALYIILQQPIRVKLFWRLLNLSFKNHEATLLLLFCHNDVVIRLFVLSGINRSEIIQSFNISGIIASLVNISEPKTSSKELFLRIEKLSIN